MKQSFLRHSRRRPVYGWQWAHNRRSYKTMDALQFVNKYQIEAKSQTRQTNPYFDGDFNHYSVTLSSPLMGGRTFKTVFSKGIALKGEPTAQEVIECLAMDIKSFDTAQDFEDWADNYGFDSDSRKAEKIFKDTEKQATGLAAFLGSSAYYELLEIED
jgi:hypothetical protein